MIEENTTNSNEEIDLDHLFDDVFEQKGEENAEGAPHPSPAAKDSPKGSQDGDAASDNDRQEKEPGPEDQAESSKERNRNAERRARREQRIADEARNAERARTTELLRRLGIERPDGSIIDSVDALEAFERSRSEERIAQGRANADDIRRIAAEVMKPPTDENAEVQRQLDMIRDMDPEMKDLGTILDSDIGADFRAAVENGKTFIQAYGQAIRLKAAKDKGAAESAVARAAGKQHLTSTNQRGTGALEVPAAEMAMYKEINPDASEEEIRKHYNANRKRTG